jgi:signal transduction histidine kinase
LVFRDATSEREAQDIIRKAEKLAAASRLAATVAHEINNPLEAVGNLVYLARSEPGTPAAAVEYLTLAEEQLERVSHIAKQTLAFYRESRKWETVDMTQLVESALKLYSNKLETKQIEVERNYSECPLLLGSAGELKQVIGNLISNAADAVSARGKLRLGLSSSSFATTESVIFRIEDDGPGIADENLGRIFEPFFTTKEDVGTGLGLWVERDRRAAWRHHRGDLGDDHRFTRRSLHPDSSNREEQRWKPQRLINLGFFSLDQHRTILLAAMPLVAFRVSITS